MTAPGQVGSYALGSSSSVAPLGPALLSDPSAELLRERKTASWLAERTVVGAVLVRPERLAEVGSWLRADYFADPGYRAVFATIAGLHDAGELAPIGAEFAKIAHLPVASQQSISENALRVRDALAERRFMPSAVGGYRDLISDVYTAGQTATLGAFMRGARKVLEAGVQRAALAWGLRMTDAIRADPTDTGDLTVLHQTHGAMVANFADLSIHIRQSQGHVVNSFDPDRVAPPAVVATAQLPARLVERSERDMIHAVVADVGWQTSGLVKRFQPEDFMNIEHGNTWRAIQELLRRSDPVDPLEVAWEAESFSADPGHSLSFNDRRALSAAALSTMTEPPTTNVRRAISTVARSAMSLHAHAAQQEIAKATTGHRADVLDTLDTVTEISGTLIEHAERLIGDDRTTKSTITRGLAGEGPAPAPHVIGPASTRPRTR